MSLPIVFRQRFRFFIGRVTNKPPQPWPGATTLFKATQFDDTNIDLIFRRALNRDDAMGMGDVLKKPFAPGSLKGTTTIEAVLTTIGKDAAAANIDAYRALIKPMVFKQLAVALAGMQFPPRPADSVTSTDSISDYVTASNIAEIAKECHERLNKWLLSLVENTDFAAPATVDEVTDRLLARMVVL